MSKKKIKELRKQIALQEAYAAVLGIGFGIKYKIPKKAFQKVLKNKIEREKLIQKAVKNIDQ